MESTVHPFAELFAQLGLPSGEADIRAFIQRHRPLAGDVAVADAPFWTPEQSRALRDMLLQDADWAEVVDQLNLALH
ncbi:DUF2789 domain-containing protein [Roseateles chitosanitabidus]|jgi:hypothetical protein|uniref:DUF2789 domain-containing protein n=1 Tax=Roseateles chitosanitabidus TaxID=65048 RepID=UPI000833FA1F|nr:DUF2789 domain-containing protein [Roseateles chitosanitabidus]MBO9687871.1 DUF2789 domain-containing protein [Roseateles chitosanitabidus]